MFLIVLLILSYPSYTGYAGSPVSSGSCASSCHGNGTFSINVTGFPTEYQPGETYQITITASSGTIKNFNACILDSNNQSQGTLQGGFYTGTYSHAGEGTGVHGTSYDHSSYTFNWTAPTEQVGEMRLYIAAHQGNKHGPNKNLVLISNPVWVAEGKSTSGFPNTSLKFASIFSSSTLRIDIPKQNGETKIAIYSATGRLLKEWYFKNIPESGLVLRWDPHQTLQSGVYWILLQKQGYREVRKFIRISKN